MKLIRKKSLVKTKTYRSKETVDEADAAATDGILLKRQFESAAQ